MNTQILIKEANSLPVEERAIIVDSLLKTLNTPESDIDQKWVTVAKARLQQIRSGEVKPIPGEEVFSNIRSRFSK
ncbi:MAG: addiction module protein [Candidatus Parabeggiatoa sp. nov. 3]|nr:MAG: addiction module protein [Gammaproteobacteria bacterium]RKZ67664.1 MAG: addiction module protein [Gammaproteobacteria bacterium]RKZ88959.1 MAG: addiction module protein [Gammaproteobacteria bacterium]